MPTIAQLTDFVKATARAGEVDPKVINETSEQFYFLGNMLKGKDDADVFQGGEKLVVYQKTSDQSNYRHYLPGEQRSYSPSNTLAELEVPWRFAETHYTYTEAEALLNTGKERIINLIQHKRNDAEQDLWTGMEADLWATPATADMEAAGGRKPYSLLSFITDAGALPAGFSTLMGDTWSSRGNQYVTYTSTDDDTILPAFDEMFVLLNWQKQQQSFADATNWSKFTIPTDKAGKKKVMSLLRNNQGGNILKTNNGADLGAGVQDCTYQGVPIIWVPKLDDLSWANPKWLWINTQFLHPTFHTSKYMTEEAPITPSAQPDTRVVRKVVWYNVVCTSRRRQGIVVAA